MMCRFMRLKNLLDEMITLCLLVNTILRDIIEKNSKLKFSIRCVIYYFIEKYKLVICSEFRFIAICPAWRYFIMLFLYI